MWTRACVFCVGLAIVAAGEDEPASIAGRVVSTRGDAVAGAQITLQPERAGLRTYAASSDGEGGFSLAGLEPGAYTLSASHPGYVAGEATLLRVAAGQALKDVAVRLTPQATASGRTVNDQGDPVPLAQVVLFRYRYSFGQRRIVPESVVFSNGSGEFRTDDIAPGRYYVAVSPPESDAPSQELGYVMTFYPGVSAAAAASAVEIAAGDSTSLGDLRLQKTQVFHIKGRIRRRASEGGIDIRALPDGLVAPGPFLSPSTEPQPDGSFDLGGVPPGLYTLAATNRKARTQILARQPVAVNRSDLADVVLSIAEPTEVSCRIVVESQSREARKPGRVSVVLLPGDAVELDVLRGQEGAGGSLVFRDVEPGLYTVAVQSLPKGTYLKSIRSGGQDVLAAGLDLTQGGPVRDLTITLAEAAAQIEGLVQDAEGKAVSAVVTLVPDPGGPERAPFYQRTATDQNGEFKLGNLAPGAYCVYAWSTLEPGEEFNPEQARRFADRCTAVKVKETEVKKVTVTRLAPAE